MASAVPALLIFCLVLLVSPRLGCSYHTSFTDGGKHYVVRSNSDPRQPKSSPSCSSVHSGSNDGMTVVHRLSPCSPLGAASGKQEKAPSVAHVLRRDALRLRSLFGDDDNSASSPVPPPLGGGVEVPTRGDPTHGYPGAFEYHVIAGFGTPAQLFAVGFDTHTPGATLLNCKPCGGAGDPCRRTFDPAASSSLAAIPCGSPDCPFHGRCSGGGPSCTLTIRSNSTVLFNLTFVTDTLALAPSATLDRFRFACLEEGLRVSDDHASGVLDLSRNSHSLASRAPSAPGTVAFSYCLPAHLHGRGFLSVGRPGPERSGRRAAYTPLRGDAGDGNLYVVDLVGVGFGGSDLPFPPGSLAGETIMEVQTAFTYLPPAAYAVLRDSFRRAMSGYPPAPPPVDGLDTCYNFTGLPGYGFPTVSLRFASGADLELSIPQTLYFSDPEDPFSVGCLAFAPLPRGASSYAAVVGSMAQMSTEVVYDVRGGKVGFVPNRC